jgi:hypothetical protein
MTRLGTQLSFWFVRAPLAVVGGVIIGQVVQVPLAFLLDLFWQNDVTGGRWPLTLPNILLAGLVGLIAGFSTGWVAGRRGKLLGAIAIFLPLLLLLTITIIRNVDPTEYFKQLYDTKPSLWVWVALLPGILGGHFGALDGKRYFNRSALFCAAGFAWVAGIGFSLFHLYTAFIAFEAAGFVAAIITLSFPVIAELYWGWRIWNESGYFLNHYSSLIVMLVVFLVIAGVAGIAYAKTKKWVESTDGQ